MSWRNLSGPVLITLSLWLSACGQPPRQPPPRPHVILVSIDTLRADHVSEAPYLSRLRAEGRSFSSMYSSSNWTLPSHISLFTAQPYLEHDLPPRQSSGAHPGVRIPDDQPTLAKAMAAAGYATMATTEGGWIRPAFGLDAGFDHFHMSRPPSEGGFAVFDEHLRLTRDFLDQVNGPFFLFVHTYWVHDYFVNSPEYHDLATADDEPYIGLGNLLKNVPAEERGSIPVDFVQRLYRSGVRRADSFLEKLVSEISQATHDAPMLLVVTSDHGENLGDRAGSWGHGHSLDEDQVRVPLIAWSNTDDAPRGPSSVSASTIDVAPSILRWLGLAIPERFHGSSDRLLAKPAPSLVLAGHHAWASSPEAGLTNRALISQGWKYVHSNAFDGRPLSRQCFHLATDPSGRENLMDENGPECIRLRDTLARLLTLHADNQSELPETLPESDPEMLKQLRALGYLGGD